ncbi:unnamed protein product [Cochlearia groenlandica]
MKRVLIDKRLAKTSKPEKKAMKVLGIHTSRLAFIGVPVLGWTRAKTGGIIWVCAIKRDFFPEESFKSFATYTTTLSQTYFRFKNRLISRSDDENEWFELKKPSENDLKRCLTWWDLVWFGLGSVFPLCSLFSATQNSPSKYPWSAALSPIYASSWEILRRFIDAGNILLESIVGTAAVARAWTSYFSSLLNRKPNDFRIKTDLLCSSFDLLDPIFVAVLAASATIAWLISYAFCS